VEAEAITATATTTVEDIRLTTPRMPDPTLLLGGTTNPTVY